MAAAVVLLSEALTILFCDDVAQLLPVVLDGMMDCFMEWKERVEEIVWATLMEVVYRMCTTHTIQRRRPNHDDVSLDDDTTLRTTSSGGSSQGPSSPCPRMVSRAILESDLDLEGEEVRGLDHGRHRVVTHLPATLVHPEQPLPRYNDSVLALRILVDCLIRLKRLDDVESFLREGMEREIRTVVEREQAKTLARLETLRSIGEETSPTNDDDVDHPPEDDELKEFHRHLQNMLQSFRGVMTRLFHLTQMVRYKLGSDPLLAKLCPSYPQPSSALHSIIVAAETAMQREIKGFLSACIAESDKDKRKGNSNSRSSYHPAMNLDQSQMDVERGIFSLGIHASTELGWTKAATRANIVELPADQFVSNVLFARSNAHPEVRHALAFRRSISKWCQEITEGKKELAICSGQDTQSHAAMDESPLAYMDTIIQRTLLPEMQDEAVNAVIHFLERQDAFDPIVGDAFSRFQKDAEMSVACQALYTSTRPIFMALHRLPKGGDMYLSLVSVIYLLVVFPMFVYRLFAN